MKIQVKLNSMIIYASGLLSSKEKKTKRSKNKLTKCKQLLRNYLRPKIFLIDKTSGPARLKSELSSEDKEATTAAQASST